MNAPTAHAPSQPNLVPRAAQAHVDEANRLIAELNAPAAAAPPPAAGPQWRPGTPGPSNAAPGVPDQPPAAPPPRAAAPPPTAAAVAAAVAAAEPQPLEEENRRLRAAYQTLQGKYNSEIGGLRATLTQQGELLNSLVRERAAPAPAAPPVQQSPEEILRSLGATDKDIEDYGELLPIVARLAQNMFQPTLRKLEAQLSQLQRENQGTRQELVKTRQETLEEDLDRAISNWRFINQSQEFLDWLDQFDIFSGTTRRVALAGAYKALDSHRVVGIFQAYVQEYPAAIAASAAPPVDTETLLQPAPRGGQGPAAPEGASSKRIVSESEIRDFYTKVRKKQVSPEEYARFSEELAVATREGRVRPDRANIHLNS